MTREKIIDALLNSGKISDNQLKFDLFTGDIAKLADELLALIEQEKDDLLKEFVEWLKKQNCIIMQQDCAGTMKCDFALEKFLEDRK